MASGIYQIRNLVNDKIYIGSAIKLTKRKNDHLSDLSRGKHCNSYLQRSYDKYGKDKFKFEILMTCPKEDLIRVEQYHLDNYKPEYNICKTAGNVLGIKRTDKTKLKMSLAAKGKTISVETRLKLSLLKKGKPSKKKIPVQQLDLAGNIINEFASAYDVYTSLKIKRTSVQNCVSGLSKSAGGFKWKYKNDK